MLLASVPTLPLATPVRLTQARFGRVPRVYIECLRDHAITPPLQKQMVATSPCAKVFSIEPTDEVLRRRYEALDRRTGLYLSYSVAYIPVKLIGVGEKLEDLRPFEPEEFARALVS